MRRPCRAAPRIAIDPTATDGGTSPDELLVMMVEDDERRTQTHLEGRLGSFDGAPELSHGPPVGLDQACFRLQVPLEGRDGGVARPPQPLAQSFDGEQGLLLRARLAELAARM